MADKPKSKRVITPEATAMFVYVWEPREPIVNGKVVPLFDVPTWMYKP